MRKREINFYFFCFPDLPPELGERPRFPEREPEPELELEPEADLSGLSDLSDLSERGGRNRVFNMSSEMTTNKGLSCPCSFGLIFGRSSSFSSSVKLAGRPRIAWMKLKVWTRPSAPGGEVSLSRGRGS